MFRWERSGARALLKPMVFAKLLQAAAIGENDRVLDVGCATGYSAAVLGRLAGAVTALEEDPALGRAASEALGGIANVSVANGPLAAGWAQGAPYDVILLEGSGEDRSRGVARAAQGRRTTGGRCRQRTYGQGRDLSKGGRTREFATAVRRHGAGIARFCEAARLRFLTCANPRRPHVTVARLRHWR